MRLPFSARNPQPAHIGPSVDSLPLLGRGRGRRVPLLRYLGLWWLARLPRHALPTMPLVEEERGRREPRGALRSRGLRQWQRSLLRRRRAWLHRFVPPSLSPTGGGGARRGPRRARWPRLQQGSRSLTCRRWSRLLRCVPPSLPLVEDSGTESSEVSQGESKTAVTGRGRGRGNRAGRGGMSHKGRGGRGRGTTPEVEQIPPSSRGVEDPSWGFLDGSAAAKGGVRGRRGAPRARGPSAPSGKRLGRPPGSRGRGSWAGVD